MLFQVEKTFVPQGTSGRSRRSASSALSHASLAAKSGVLPPELSEETRLSHVEKLVSVQLLSYICINHSLITMAPSGNGGGNGGYHARIEDEPIWVRQ